MSRPPLSPPRTDPSDAAGTLVLPAGSPYERELLVEHLLSVARRCGAVRVRMDGCDCLHVWQHLAAGARCVGCGVAPRGLHARRGAHVWCARCALERAVTRSARDTCCAEIAPARAHLAVRA